MNNQYFPWDWLQKGVFVILMAAIPIFLWIPLRFREFIEDEQTERIPWWLTGVAKALNSTPQPPLRQVRSRIAIIIASLFFPVLALCSDIPEPYSVRFLVIFLAAVLAGLTIALFEWLVRPRKIYELDEWDED